MWAGLIGLGMGISYGVLCESENKHLGLYKGLIAHSGGWSPNWVHSAPRPFTVLLCLPRVIVRMENYSVE
jgi:hypothetical protein